MPCKPRVNPKLAKYTYPSIEYVLATAHYPEAFRKDARCYPQYVPTPPVQLFHVAAGHIPLFVPLPGERAVPRAQPQKTQSTTSSRIVRYRFRQPIPTCKSGSVTAQATSLPTASTTSTSSSSESSDEVPSIALSPPPRRRDNRPTRPLPHRQQDRSVQI